MKETAVVLVALYHYWNFPVRIMHPLLEKIEGVKPYTIFFKGSEANAYSAPTEKEEGFFRNLIKDLRPELVGISVLSPFVPVAKRLTKIVKDNASSLVAWGGVHPTILPEACVAEADMLCIGEGEGAITDLVESLRDKKPYHSIRNLWVKDGASVVKNPMRPLIQDIDVLPFPAFEKDSFHFINNNTLTQKDPWRTGNYYWMQSSRGCPYSCSFCVNSLLRPMLKGLGSPVRRRSVDNLLKELKENNRCEYVLFVDEVFASQESWLDEFTRRYKKEIGLPFFVDYNPKNLSSSVIKKLVESGIDVIHFGIQSGSDRIRNDVFRRPGTNREIISLAREIADRGVRIKYDLILNNPYDTEETMRETVEFLLQLPKPLFFSLYTLQYFPDYPLTKRAIEDGYIKPEDASVESLLETTPKTWSVVPKYPRSKKQALENVVWLIVRNHVRDRLARQAVFGTSRSAKALLAFLNMKALLYGKILGEGGLVFRNPWLRYLTNALRYAFRGDLKALRLKLKKHLLRAKGATR